MTANQQEALASLQVLACVAKADGEPQQQERDTLAKALQQLQPMPEGVTVESLLAQEVAIAQVLAQITTPEAQRAVYAQAYALAQINGITPAQKQLLHQIRATFQLQLENWSPAKLSNEPLPAIAEPDIIPGMLAITQRSWEVRNTILDYAIGAAILGLIPIRGLLILELKLLAAGILIFKMMRDIAGKWGYPKGQDMLAIAGNIFGGLGALSLALMAWVTVFCIGLFVPFVGSMAFAASFFTLTWTLGQVTNQFYINGCRIDAAALKKALQNAKK